MNKKIIVAILLLCAVLSMGCIGEPLNTSANVFVDEPETKLDVLTPQPVIKFDQNNYYNQGNILNKYDMTFDEFMDSNWNSDNQYELNNFDCSQMSTYMEWVLENSGYNTVIMLSDDHAWILVEFSDGWLAYECTGCYWVYYDDDPSYYMGYLYENIYEIYDYHIQFSNGEEIFIREFKWW